MLPRWVSERMVLGRVSEREHPMLLRETCPQCFVTIHLIAGFANVIPVILSLRHVAEIFHRNLNIFCWLTAMFGDLAMIVFNPL